MRVVWLIRVTQRRRQISKNMNKNKNAVNTNTLFSKNKI